MEANKKLKITAGAFIGLGILDIAKFAINYFNGTITTALNTADATPEMKNVAIGITITIIAIIALIKIFLGYKGFRYADGKTEKTGFITFMKVILVVLVIQTVATLLNKNGIDYHSLIVSLLNVAIVSIFIKNATAVRENRN